MTLSTGELAGRDLAKAATRGGHEVLWRQHLDVDDGLDPMNDVVRVDLALDPLLSNLVHGRDHGLVHDGYAGSPSGPVQSLAAGSWGWRLTGGLSGDDFGVDCVGQVHDTTKPLGRLVHHAAVARPWTGNSRLGGSGSGGARGFHEASGRVALADGLPPRHASHGSRSFVGAGKAPCGRPRVRATGIRYQADAVVWMLARPRRRMCLGRYRRRLISWPASALARRAVDIREV